MRYRSSLLSFLPASLPLFLSVLFFSECLQLSGGVANSHGVFGTWIGSEASASLLFAFVNLLLKVAGGSFVEEKDKEGRSSYSPLFFSFLFVLS